MKYTINSIGWTGLLVMFTIMLFSCKKEENKSASTGTPTPTIGHHLIGKYACNDMNAVTRDTIYIYKDVLSNWMMTCPDANASSSQDTISFGLNADDVNFTIPTQYIYGTAATITGSGSKLISTQCNITWTRGSTSTTYTDIIYIKQ